MASWILQNVYRFLAEDYFMSDQSLAIFVPVVVYWTYSGMYMMLGSLEKYRLHPMKEEEQKNMVSKREVIRGVLLQQATQSVIAMTMLLVIGKETPKAADAPPNSLIVLALQFVVGIVFMDTWQYFLHRYMHINKFLYRHVHSLHHKLVVPYAFGSLYLHPVDAIVDTIGAGLCVIISGMSTRMSIYFFSFLTMKVVDDHCGLLLPGNPFHMIFPNNTAFHDSHHQLFANKYNFGNLFFTWWDKMLGTYMPYTVEKRATGGYEVKQAKEEARD